MPRRAGSTRCGPGPTFLGDRQQAALGAIPADALAAHVIATVVSTAVPGQVVIDAGAKALTKDRAPFLTGFGGLPAYPDAVIERVNDYHGIVLIPPGAGGPHLGEVVAVAPNHVCPVGRPVRHIPGGPECGHRGSLAGRRARPERLTPR